MRPREWAENFVAVQELEMGEVEVVTVSAEAGYRHKAVKEKRFTRNSTRTFLELTSYIALGVELLNFRRSFAGFCRLT
jgi:hypothetical protein